MPALTPNEDRILAYLYEVGAPVPEIAKRLGHPAAKLKKRINTRQLRRDPDLVGEYLELIALDGERWASISAASRYFVSDAGRVAAARQSGAVCILTPEVDKDGYHRVCLTFNDGVRRHQQVHRLVAERFVEGRRPGLQVAHWDGSRSNNRASNLRWTTCAENHADKVRHGTDPVGSRHPLAICDERKAAKVKQLIRAGA